MRERSGVSDKPFSPSCERNREPILAVLREHFADRTRVLEIGSGTGQHAVYFAAAMPWLHWQCSDRAEYLPGIRAWLDEAALANTPAPIELDVATGPWPGRAFDAVFSANTLHIMGWPEVEACFAGLDARAGRRRDAGGVRAVQLRRRLHQRQQPRVRRLAARARSAFAASAISRRCDALARAIGLQLVEDIAMPANNRCLVWRRQS